MSKKFNKILSLVIVAMLSILFVPSIKTKAATNLGDRLLVGYWHNFINGAGVIRLSEVSNSWDVINVSFGETFGDKAVVELHPVYDEVEFIKDIKNLQLKGKKVVLSLGGAEGAIKISTEADRQKFMTSVVGLIEKYGFDGIDIDLEGGSGMILQSGDTDFRNPTTPQIVNFIKSIKELDKKYGSDFIISMAPELSYVQGGIIAYANNWGAYLPLIHGVRDQLDYLQVQHYNSGGNLCLDGNTYKEGTADFHVSMIDMLLKGFPIGGNKNNMFPPLRQNQIVIGVPSSTPSAGSGYTAPAEMKKALDYLIKGQSFGGQYKMEGNGYPELRGMMTWSINWDVKYNSEFINNYRPYFDALPKLNDALKKASISSSDVVNGNYELTVNIPSRNTATSYKVIEGITAIASGTLKPSLTEAQVITNKIINKQIGSYKYTVVLTDEKGQAVTSSELVVTVKDPNEKPKPSVDNYDSVHPYTFGDIVIYNGKEYKSQGWWVVGITPGTNDGVWKPMK